MDGQGEDLAELAALAAPRPTRARAKGRSAAGPPTRRECGPDAPLVAHDEGADLAALAALAAEPPTSRSRARSWEALAVARATKAAKRATTAAEEASAGRARAEAMVQAVVTDRPLLARRLGVAVPRTGGSMHEARAQSVLRLAFSPTVKGDASLQLLQKWAANSVAHCALDAQEQCVRDMFLVGGSPIAPELAPQQSRIHIIEWGPNGNCANPPAMSGEEQVVANPTDVQFGDLMNIVHPHQPRLMKHVQTPS